MTAAVPAPFAYLSLSRLIQFGGIAVLTVIAAPIILVMFVDPLLFAGMPGHLAAGERMSALAHSTALYHPLLFYFAAFWFLQSACGRIASGRMFEQRTKRAIILAGAALMAGAAASLVTRPLMLSGAFVIDPATAEKMGYLRIMYGHMDMTISAVVIGAVGGMLVLMGFVMDRGAAAHAENEQMF